MEQSKDNNQPKNSQTKRWSDAEVRRVARVFDLLLRIDQRKRGKGNEQTQNPKNKQATD